MKVLAGIVLFNPDIGRLIENLDGVVNQVDEVVCVDNGSSNADEIQILLGRYPIKIIRNDDNKGIAKALNQILRYAVENSYEWFLTLDQDSVCYQGLIKAYEKYISFDAIGMITCWAVDRNIKSEEKFKDGEEYEYVTYCITSGALVNTAACMACGGGVG